MIIKYQLLSDSSTKQLLNSSLTVTSNSVLIVIDLSLVA